MTLSDPFSRSLGSAGSTILLAWKPVERAITRPRPPSVLGRCRHKRHLGHMMRGPEVKRASVRPDVAINPSQTEVSARRRPDGGPPRHAGHGTAAASELHIAINFMAVVEAVASSENPDRPLPKRAASRPTPS